MTGAPFQTAPDKFTAQGTLDRVVRAHAGVRAVAVALFKIANGLRWLGSGPRTGLHELLLPANEPGSSIMPGKVNPTQAEAMPMVCIQIIASDVAVTIGGAEGNFELNAFRPILINNYLHSALIMADMCDHLREYMIVGAELNQPRLKENIERSVMMVTALWPIIGYDKASVISHYAIDHDLTLKQAALDNGVSEELYDRVVNPLALTRGGSADLAVHLKGVVVTDQFPHPTTRDAAPSRPVAELVTKTSPRSVADTVARLTSSVEAKGMKVFAVIDHSGEAKRAGLDLRETMVVIFGSPQAGTPVMAAVPLAALDLPLKVLVWTDSGTTKLSYTAPTALAARYDLPDELGARLAGIDALTDAVISG